jgi:hypothetical protein
MATSSSCLAIHWTSSITRPPPFPEKRSYTKFQKNYGFHVPRSEIKPHSHQFHWFPLGYWPFHVPDLYNISKRSWHLHYQSSQHNDLLNKRRLLNTRYLRLEWRFNKPGAFVIPSHSDLHTWGVAVLTPAIKTWLTQKEMYAPYFIAPKREGQKKKKA